MSFSSGYKSLPPKILRQYNSNSVISQAKKAVELRTSKHTTAPGALQQGEDYVKALALGFEVDDAIALLRLDDLYVSALSILILTFIWVELGRNEKYFVASSLEEIGLLVNATHYYSNLLDLLQSIHTNLTHRFKVSRSKMSKHSKGNIRVVPLGE